MYTTPRRIAAAAIAASAILLPQVALADPAPDSASAEQSPAAPSFDDRLASLGEHDSSVGEIRSFVEMVNRIRVANGAEPLPVEKFYVGTGEFSELSHEHALAKGTIPAHRGAVLSNEVVRGNGGSMPRYFGDVTGGDSAMAWYYSEQHRDILYQLDSEKERYGPGVEGSVLVWNMTELRDGGKNGWDVNYDARAGWTPADYDTSGLISALEADPSLADYTPPAPGSVSMSDIDTEWNGGLFNSPGNRWGQFSSGRSYDAFLERQGLKLDRWGNEVPMDYVEPEIGPQDPVEPPVEEEPSDLAATDDVVTVREGESISIDVLANDTLDEGATIESLAFADDPDSDFISREYGAFVIEDDNTISFHPVPGWTEEARATYVVTDSTGTTASADIVVTVEAVPVVPEEPTDPVDPEPEVPEPPVEPEPTDPPVDPEPVEPEPTDPGPTDPEPPVEPEPEPEEPVNPEPDPEPEVPADPEPEPEPVDPDVPVAPEPEVPEDEVPPVIAPDTPPQSPVREVEEILDPDGTIRGIIGNLNPLPGDSDYAPEETPAPQPAPAPPIESRGGETEAPISEPQNIPERDEASPAPAPQPPAPPTDPAPSSGDGDEVPDENQGEREIGPYGFEDDPTVEPESDQQDTSGGDDAEPSPDTDQGDSDPVATDEADQGGVLSPAAIVLMTLASAAAIGIGAVAFFRAR